MQTVQNVASDLGLNVLPETLKTRKGLTEVLRMGKEP